MGKCYHAWLYGKLLREGWAVSLPPVSNVPQYIAIWVEEACAAKAQEKGDQMTHHFLKLKRSRLNDCWPSYGRGLSSGRQRWLGALRSRVMMPTGRESCESKLECLLVELYWFREHSFLASLNPRWGLISPPLPPQYLQALQGSTRFLWWLFPLLLWEVCS